MSLLKKMKEISVVTWNIGTYDGKEGTAVKDACVDNKLKILEDLVKHELPELFCIVEGTISKTDKKLEALFKKYNYFTYYEPGFVKRPEYSDFFEATNFETYAIKIFIKEDIKDLVEPIDPTRVVHKGRLINVEFKNNLGVFIFLHRNMSRSKMEQNDFIKEINNWCFVGKLGAIATNTFIIGDFNLWPWNNEYFTENAGYLEVEFTTPTYEVKSRNSSVFYNPIFNTLENSKHLNTAGTFYSKNHGWGIYDYVLIKNYKSDRDFFEIVIKTKNYELINQGDLTLTQNFINHEFDHLPIKLKTTL